MAEFKRIVTVAPAYDRRHPDPAKNYGIAACRILFVLKGPRGSVQFMIGTDWYLPATQNEMRDQLQAYDRKFNKIQPQGWDVGYHSPKPMYEGQTAMDRPCEYVEGGKCYYDGSSLRADDWVPKFIAGGTDWLWKELEKEYHAVFTEKDSAA